MWVISDLHLIDVKSEDLALINFLSGIPDRSLILLGDIFDLRKASLDSILQAHPALIPLLFQKTAYYVVGNHDLKMLSFRLFMNGVPIFEKLILNGVLFMHGHQFDLANKDGHSIGVTITKAVDWLEDHIYAGIGRAARAVEQWLRRQGKFGRPKDYRKQALNYIERFQIEGKPVICIVLGHTHKADYGVSGQFEYFNTGSWFNKATDRLFLGERK